MGNVDECAEDNGGCTHTCLDNEESYECLFPDNMYLEADNKTCASIDDCASSPCEQQCIDTASGFFCECGAGFAPLGQTCVAVVDVATSFADAAAACTGLGARLMAVNDLGTAILVGRVAAGAWVGSSSELEAGVFVNSDGNVNALDNWADGSPGDFNKCVYVDANGKFNTDNCLFRRQSVKRHVPVEKSFSSVLGQMVLKLELPGHRITILEGFIAYHDQKRIFMVRYRG